MRKIKLRVFEKSTNKMYEIGSHILHSHNGSRGLLLEMYSDGFRLIERGHHTERELCDNKTAVLIRPTGLKDKSGKEIYEGDVLLNTNPKFETGVPFVTEWGDKHNYSGWMFRRKGQVVGNLFIYRNLENCEIIGNIYENPELLEPPTTP